jgi:hypothetical protein
MDNPREPGASRAFRIEASDGRVCEITRAQVRAIWQGTSGNPASRRQATIDGIKALVVQAFGAEYVDPRELVLTVDTSTGDVSLAVQAMPSPPEVP